MRPVRKPGDRVGSIPGQPAVHRLAGCAMALGHLHHRDPGQDLQHGPVSLDSSAPVFRTAIVTSAPEPASARAVSEPDAGGAAGHDSAHAGQVDAPEDLSGSRLRSERGCDEIMFHLVLTLQRCR